MYNWENTGIQKVGKYVEIVKPYLKYDFIVFFSFEPGRTRLRHSKCRTPSNAVPSYRKDDSILG